MFKWWQSSLALNLCSDLSPGQCPGSTKEGWRGRGQTACFKLQWACDLPQCAALAERSSPPQTPSWTGVSLASSWNYQTAKQSVGDSGSRWLRTKWLRSCVYFLDSEALQVWTLRLGWCILTLVHGQELGVSSIEKWFRSNLSLSSPKWTLPQMHEVKFWLYKALQTFTKENLGLLVQLPLAILDLLGWHWCPGKGLLEPGPSCPLFATVTLVSKSYHQ